MKFVGAHANVAYGLMLQDMARLSEFFCDRANSEGLVDVLLVNANIYRSLPFREVSYHLSMAYLSRLLSSHTIFMTTNFAWCVASTACVQLFRLRIKAVS